MSMAPSRFFRSSARTALVAGFCVLVALTLAAAARAVTVTLKDGRAVTGLINTVAGVAENPNAPAKLAGGVDVRPILLIDNGLKRTFVSKQQVVGIDERAAGGAPESIRIEQRVAKAGARIGSIGPILGVTPFDEFGRRIFSMSTVGGRADVVQGITLVTPVFTRVQSLMAAPKTFVWETRIATSSIPRETLSKILNKAIDPKNSDQRLRIVNLYLQSERYEEAEAELRQVIADFPELDQLKEQVRAIKQLSARRIVREIQLRRNAGQHRLVEQLLAKFPAKDVAGETLQHVEEIAIEYESLRKRGERVIKKFDEQLALVKQKAVQYRIEPIRKEIGDELGFNTLDRMDAFLQLVDDKQLLPEQKLSLAISGWLMGRDNAIENLPVALSLVDVRAEVLKYLRTTTADQRQVILESLASLEGASPAQVDKLVELLRPPHDTPQAGGGPEGYFELSAPGLEGGPDVNYYVQLPPEYDWHRKYPTVVTLNGAGSTPELQLDWWAGGVDADGRRLGQAARHGYIVIAVDWQKPHQAAYEYSAREHHAVLSSLRDAGRRFSIDTDRVFLSGHDIGGDAVWDMGPAHPDLWAGVIPIVAQSDRYTVLYWKNAEYVPMYFVAGEMDGGKMSRNARELDRYLRGGFDTVVTEFLGRGHEHFYDEIQDLYEWMNRRERDFFPKDFECSTMRTWDNFFWWLELTEFPKGGAVDPVDWPPRRKRAIRVGGKINRNNGVSVKTGKGRAIVWLSPELVDFEKRITITANGRRVNSRRPFVKPELSVLLEDVRRRGDRQHPFWAKVEM